MEYCIQVGLTQSTNLVKDISHLSYLELAITGSYSSKRGNLIEIYKILTEKDKMYSNQFFQLANNDHGLRRYSMKLHKQRSRLDVRKQ